MNCHVHWWLYETKVLSTGPNDIKGLIQTSNACLARMLGVKRADMLIKLELSMDAWRAFTLTRTDLHSNEAGIAASHQLNFAQTAENENHA
jgi:hypothetical protein